MISVGDKVVNPYLNWKTPMTVSEILTSEGIGEPVALFKEGGFWRVSQLLKVETSPNEYDGDTA